MSEPTENEELNEALSTEELKSVSGGGARYKEVQRDPARKSTPRKGDTNWTAGGSETSWDIEY